MYTLLLTVGDSLVVETPVELMDSVFQFEVVPVQVGCFLPVDLESLLQLALQLLHPLIILLLSQLFHPLQLLQPLFLLVTTYASHLLL